MVSTFTWPNHTQIAKWIEVYMKVPKESKDVSIVVEEEAIEA